MLWKKPAIGRLELVVATATTLRWSSRQAADVCRCLGRVSRAEGSYWNDTNVWGTDTDVDVVIRLDNVYYSDLQYLPPEDTTRYNSAFSPAAYDLPEFKENVIKWLSLNFRG